MKTYTIELRVNYQDKEKYDIILEAAREAARTMLATAMMLKDKRDPRIALQAGDMFEQNEDLTIMEDGEDEDEEGD